MFIYQRDKTFILTLFLSFFLLSLYISNFFLFKTNIFFNFLGSVCFSIICFLFFFVLRDHS